MSSHAQQKQVWFCLVNRDLTLIWYVHQVSQNIIFLTHKSVRSRCPAVSTWTGRWVHMCKKTLQWYLFEIHSSNTISFPKWTISNLTKQKRQPCSDQILPYLSILRQVISYIFIHLHPTIFLFLKLAVSVNKISTVLSSWGCSADY